MFVCLFVAFVLNKIWLGLEGITRNTPRRGWRKHFEDEIQLAVKIGEKKLEEISIQIDEANNLRLTDTTTKKVQTYKLPCRGNFEKAVFDSMVIGGTAYITILNFTREEVEVKFSD